MKKYLILSIFIFFAFIPHLFADCSRTEENRLKMLASQVKITYEYNDSYYDDYGDIVKEMFIISITGLTDEIYALIDETSSYFMYDPNNQTVSMDGFTSGTKTIKIYSKNPECSTELRKIYLTLPKYNYYADDPLCEEIDTTKFALCDKWYQFDINYDTFLKRLEAYKNSLNNNDEPIIDPSKDNTENPIITFLKKYIVYIASALVIGITIIVVAIKKKRSDPFE